MIEINYLQIVKVPEVYVRKQNGHVSHQGGLHGVVHCGLSIKLNFLQMLYRYGQCELQEGEVKISCRQSLLGGCPFNEIPYPYTVHDTTLRPLLNITIKSTIVVRNRSIACKHCNCGDAKFFLI